MRRQRERAVNHVGRHSDGVMVCSCGEFSKRGTFARTHKELVAHAAAADKKEKA